MSTMRDTSKPAKEVLGDTHAHEKSPREGFSFGKSLVKAHRAGSAVELFFVGLLASKTAFYLRCNVFTALAKLNASIRFD